MCAGAGSATGAGGRAVAQPCPSQSTAASIGRSNGIVPPAREAAFLKMQDRAAECDRSVGKCPTETIIVMHHTDISWHLCSECEPYEEY
jgi:hypothetical protein